MSSRPPTAHGCARTRALPRAAAAMLAALSSLASTGMAAADCGEPLRLAGKPDAAGRPTVLAARQFSDGSIAVRAPLAVNPDGGPASYTTGDHGFTYIANGLALWQDGRRAGCDAACMQAFRAAEAAGFAAGTAEFCVFAMEVEPWQPGQAAAPCTGGQVVGNGKGRLRVGPELETLGGATVRPYVSTTSLRHLVAGRSSALNSEALPIAVTPRADLLGHIVWVNGAGLHGSFAVVGDSGPAFGEGSIALHQLLRTGEVTPQRPGPIAAAERCGPGEVALKPPFQARPDLRGDRCRPGTKARGGADVRAYDGMEDALDFVVLGQATLARKSNVIQSEVTLDALSGAATAAGYGTERIQQMLACLNP